MPKRLDGMSAPLATASRRGACQRLTERTEGEVTIVGLLIILVVAGGGLYILQAVPLDPTIKLILRAIIIIVVVVYVILFSPRWPGSPPGCLVCARARGEKAGR